MGSFRRVTDNFFGDAVKKSLRDFLLLVLGLHALSPSMARAACAPGMGDNLAVKVHYGVDNSDH